LWRLSVAGDLIVVLCAVPLLWIEYLLLRPVSEHLVLLAVLFNLVSLAVEAMSKVFLLAVMPTLEAADYLKSFAPQQLPILANIALRSHDIAILLPPLIGESSFCLWLLVKGVNVAKWKERAP
jgi:hypothetical protein